MTYSDRKQIAELFGQIGICVGVEMDVKTVVGEDMVFYIDNSRFVKDGERLDQEAEEELLRLLREARLREVAA